MGEIFDHLAETTYGDLPDDVIHHAKMSLLDTTGAIIAGAPHDHIDILTNYVDELETKEVATIIGRDVQVTSPHAAMVNGTMAYTVEMDDVSPAHPGSAVVPGSLAVGEELEASGQDLLTAIALGYETIARIYRTAPERPNEPYPSAFPNVRFEEVPIHKSSVVGAFGAAAAVGSLLGLDREGFDKAFGNCAIAPVAPFEACSSGGMVKPLSDAGFPSYTGTLAAQLASRGFTGTPDLLEAEQGVLTILLGDEFNYENIAEGFGEDWWAKDYVSRKRHACCTGAHTHADIVIELLEEHPELTPENVEKVDVWASEFAYNMMGTGDRTVPEDETAAKFSYPFVIATVLREGRPIALDDTTEERIRDEETLALAERVETHLYESLEMVEGQVEISTKDGETYYGEKDGFRGRYMYPLSDEDLRSKFQRLSTRVFEDDRVDGIAETILDIEESNARQLGKLL